MQSSHLITPAAAAKLFASSSASVIPLDATWYLPNAGKSGKDEFLAERIPGARFFDIDEVKDPLSPYPHMLPSAEQFSAAMGIADSLQDTIIVYDKQGNFSAPRALWMFLVFKHPSVYLLDNFPQYKKQGLPITTEKLASLKQANRTDATSTYTNNGMIAERVASYEDMVAITQDAARRESYNIIDARPYARWSGAAPEPRPGIPSGHVVGAISIAFSEVLDTQGQFKSVDELQALFLSKGMSPEKPTIAMCGTGVTACVLETALGKAGFASAGGAPNVVYDGSWTEWAQRADGSMIVQGE
ncbi:Rhodanese-like domain-containing protein [Limtongia smithiae]|uniref:Rhodanese-like domain-containing protein n=1 Tax=Limtongia smithiae TaxID=1125753 RepID=UPI0034CF8B26